MAHSLQDGLSRFERKLERLADDPQQLEQDRDRFDQPPPETPTLSGATTKSHVTRGSEDEREELLFQLERQWKASLPNRLFEELVSLESGRWMEAMKSWCRPVPLHRDYLDLAFERVRAEWIEQGIWDDVWDQVPKGQILDPSGMWQHEDEKGPDHFKSPDDDSESNSDSDSRASLDLSAPLSPVIHPVPKNDKTLQKNADHEKVSGPETRLDSSPSRPLFQFLYQLGKEREWFDDCHRAKLKDFPSADSVDFNTQAYNSVKKRWKNWGIWNSEWGVLPGMSWKHETPLLEFLEKEVKKVEKVEKLQIKAPGQASECARVEGDGDDDESQEEKVSLSIYSNPSLSASPASIVTNDRNVDLRQFIIHGNNSLASLVDQCKNDNDGGPSGTNLDSGLDSTVNLDTSIDLGPPQASTAGAISPKVIDCFGSADGRVHAANPGDASQQPCTPPAEATASQQPHSTCSSPEPSLVKPAERNGFHQRWQGFISPRKKKSHGDSPRKLKVLNYNIWVEHR